MEQSEKIIIYQVFTRLFGNEEVRNSSLKKESEAPRLSWR